MISSPLCHHCAHVLELSRQRRTCAAFPDGIPRDIMDGTLDHRLPVDGDHGIRYEHAADISPAARYATDSRPPLAPIDRGD